MVCCGVVHKRNDFGRILAVQGLNKVTIFLRDQMNIAEIKKQRALENKKINDVLRLVHFHAK